MNINVKADQVLRIERLVAAPPERVFELWTEPSQIVSWWGPEGYDIPEHAIDVRPGGSWRTTMRSPTGSLHKVSGVYRAIEKPRRVVFTWAWHDSATDARGHETEVTVTFEPVPGGTRLVLLQQEFESTNARDLHGQGWSSTVTKFEKFIAANQEK